MRLRRPKWLRHVSQLGPVIHSLLSDDEFDQAQIYKDELVRQKRAGDQFGIPAKFLGSRLHDGRLLKFKFKGRRLQMTVSHEDFEWLGLGVNKLIGRFAWAPGMPIVFDFPECTILSAYKVDLQGKLTPVRAERCSRNWDCFLYADVVPGERDSLLWACILFGGGVIGQVVVVIETEKPTIEEHHREVWLETYGSEWEWVYDAYAKVQDTVKLVDPDATAFLKSIGAIKDQTVSK